MFNFIPSFCFLFHLVLLAIHLAHHGPTLGINTHHTVSLRNNVVKLFGLLLNVTLYSCTIQTRITNSF